MPTIKVDREEFARLNAEGWTIPRLAEHFDIKPRSVTRLRTKLGIIAPTRHELTPKQLAAIESMLDDGMSQHEINRTTGVDRETIRAHFPGRGWTLREAGSFGVETALLWKQLDAASYAASSKTIRRAA